MAAIDLIVLGMIKAQPQSAYELQKNVEYRNISKWVKVSTPSIYKKVVQMEEKGYIRGKTVKEGKMPEKTVYQITETGEEFFLKLMEETARQPIRLFLDFNAVIMSLNLVSEQERRELTGRMEQEIEVMQKNRCGQAGGENECAADRKVNTGAAVSAVRCTCQMDEGIPGGISGGGEIITVDKGDF